MKIKRIQVKNIGPYVNENAFDFSLEDAIKKGILCEFEYIPLPYILTDEERAKKKKIIAAFNAKKEAGESVDEKDMFGKLQEQKTRLNARFADVEDKLHQI